MLDGRTACDAGPFDEPTEPERRAMRAVNKKSRRVRDIARKLSPVKAPFSAESPWFYANIQYGDRWMGLLIETDDEVVARREAEQLCDLFDGRAVLCSLRRVVVQ